MNEEDLEAAVQITRRHENKTYYEGGIGKYGLGLKKAATCLGDNWKVITKEMNSDSKFSVNVDVLKLWKNDSSELEIKDQKSNSRHGTRIEINLRKIMKGSNAKSVKNSIAEMYRYYIDKENIRIWWNDEKLSTIHLLPELQVTTKDGLKKDIWWSNIELDVKVKSKKVNTAKEKFIFRINVKTRSEFNFSIRTG